MLFKQAGKRCPMADCVPLSNSAELYENVKY